MSATRKSSTAATVAKALEAKKGKASSTDADKEAPEETSEAEQEQETAQDATESPQEPSKAEEATPSLDERFAAMEARLEAAEQARMAAETRAAEAEARLTAPPPAEALAEPQPAPSEVSGEATRMEVKGSRQGNVGQEEDATHVIHFVADGMTLLGRTWYRGEELRLREGSDQWQRITDTQGWNIFAIADDPEAQYLRYDEEKFRSGPWPFRQLSQAELEAIASGEGFGSIEEAERARKMLARRRAAGQTGGAAMPIQAATRSISP